MIFFSGKYRFAATAFLAAALLVVGVPSSTRGSGATAAAAPAAAPKPAVSSIGDAYDGELYGYRVSFWYFKKAAEASVGISSVGNGRYKAVLSAHTTGVLSWVPGLRHREDTFTALLEETDGGRRFRTLEYEEVTKLGSKLTKKTFVFDYAKRSVQVDQWKNGEHRRSFVLTFKEGESFDDPLCAFYNFRYGVYGPIKAGSEYRIKTIPRKKDGEDIELLLSLISSKDYDARYLKANGEGYYAYVKLDKEFLDSSSGNIEILFDPAMAPKATVAKDIMLFGDVKGALTGATRPKKAVSGKPSE
ncbi:MAG: DUF3108 domain-containing protein [Deltaproteobacteria bacterium]|nr:DUF3108 domain-containing protein [Deltaproteobacteria bacterium]